MSKISAIDICLDLPVLGVRNRSIKNKILQATTGGLISPGEKTPIINALRDINLSLAEGDRLGLIGHNGAGKSTLLKVLAGIYTQTKGDLVIQGRVVSMLNLSLGMELEATGRENIISRGLLFGMRKAEINSQIDEIIAFTELGAYVDMPVRVYSSGMLTRLTFATATAMKADIMLMDEVMGTGDAFFYEKAEQRLNSFINQSKILVLASHNESILRKFCNKAALLDHGKILKLGNVEDVLKQYAAICA